MKKVLTSVIVVVMLLSIVCCCVACNKKAPLDQVIDCAKALKEMVNDESFEISGDCGYQKYFEFEGTTYLYIYIAIQFKYTDESEEEVYDVAYFVDGKFVGYESNYEDESYEEWSESKQLRFLESSLIYVEGEYTEVYKKEEINSALGIGVSSGEITSGTDAQ
ncbi:MAG: hypothetical protein K2L70_02220 [Clostridia bacterium]|nr:hypothetical protein [Clostridia bacterium]